MEQRAWRSERSNDNAFLGTLEEEGIGGEHLSVPLRGKGQRIALGQLNAVRQPLEDGPAGAVLLDKRKVDLGAEHLEARRGRVDRRVEVDGPLDLRRRQIEVEDDLRSK